MKGILHLDTHWGNYLVDDNELKHGCYGPGTSLVIKSVEELVNNKPDYVFLFSWNYREQILGKIFKHHLVSIGTITPLPELLVELF